jgi:hypothetical protein
MKRINAILQIGDKVRIVNTNDNLRFQSSNPRTPHAGPVFSDIEEGSLGVVTRIGVTGFNRMHQPRYVDVTLDSGALIVGVNVKEYIRRVINLQDCAFDETYNIGDIEDESLWFHMTNAMDFGG